MAFRLERLSEIEEENSCVAVAIFFIVYFSKDLLQQRRDEVLPCPR